jgi:hypothetical protein
MRQPHVQHFVPRLAPLRPGRTGAVRPWAESAAISASADPVRVPAGDRTAKGRAAHVALHAEHHADKNQRLVRQVRVNDHFGMVRVDEASPVDRALCRIVKPAAAATRGFAQMRVATRVAFQNAAAGIDATARSALAKRRAEAFPCSGLPLCARRVLQRARDRGQLPSHPSRQRASSSCAWPLFEGMPGSPRFPEPTPVESVLDYERSNDSGRSWIRTTDLRLIRVTHQSPPVATS